MKHLLRFRYLLSLLCLLMPLAAYAQQPQKISREMLREKIRGYWLGQLAGNYVGFPFENLYTDEPIPRLIDRYYNVHALDSLSLKMNTDDRRGYTHIMADAMGGAWSDDDTDIEFVTLHAVEAYGLDLTYPEITRMWKQHINRFIWSAARKTRDLMEEGYLPPATGSQALNPYWYRITSQLMNEIWGVFYPGMVKQAVERSDWAAYIITDQWATHPDRVYGAMYSAAFFEEDVPTLLRIGMNHLPEDSPFRRGMEDIFRWHAEGKSWREARQLMHQGYYASIDGFAIPYPVGGSIINGLSSVMALLYGEGDFTKTVAIATSLGYDCDNQAATVGGLIGVIRGAQHIPTAFTLDLPSRATWAEPFNNQYINYSRDGLPNFNTIDGIVERILTVSEQAILAHGGEKFQEHGQWMYRIQTSLK